jgi:hypothetical protein
MTSLQARSASAARGGPAAYRDGDPFDYEAAVWHTMTPGP